jgi:hypothetical protein
MTMSSMLRIVAEDNENENQAARTGREPRRWMAFLVCQSTHLVKSEYIVAEYITRPAFSLIDYVSGDSVLCSLFWSCR